LTPPADRASIVAQFGVAMAGKAIPDNLRRYLLASSLTVPHVEAILLLRHDPQSHWDAPALASRLYVPERRARQLLGELVEMRIFAEDASAAQYTYRPQSAELASLLDQLADEYARHLVEITRLIHTATSTAAEQFADAFRFRKDDR
jgi:hypothetical protein